jgi:hypothetical protein
VTENDQLDSVGGSGFPQGVPCATFAVPVAGLPEDARATGAARTRVGRPDVSIPELSPFDGGSRSAGIVEDVEASFAGAEDSSNELKARTRGALSYFQMTGAPGGGGVQNTPLRVTERAAVAVPRMVVPATPYGPWTGCKIYSSWGEQSLATR